MFCVSSFIHDFVLSLELSPKRSFEKKKGITYLKYRKFANLKEKLSRVFGDAYINSSMNDKVRRDSAFKTEKNSNGLFHINVRNMNFKN